MKRTTLLFGAIILAGAIGAAFPASMAMAQDGQNDKSGGAAAAPKPASVGGVVVEAPRQKSGLGAIPPDKAAAFDQEAAKNEAWKRYRKSTPPFDARTLDQAKDYPGLQSLLPLEDQPVPGAAAR